MDGLIYKVAAAGIAAAFLVLALKKESPAFGLAAALAASVLILLTITPRLSAVFELIGTVAGRLSGGREYVELTLKIIGIAYVSEFGANVCEDAGESGIARKIELAGKVLILTVSAPVILSLLDRVLSMLG